MSFHQLMALKTEAWQAFFDVFRANGVEEYDLQRLRDQLNFDDCYNDVDDALVEVFL